MGCRTDVIQLNRPNSQSQSATGNTPEETALSQPKPASHLVIQIDRRIVSPGKVSNITATGGVLPYSFAIQSGPGTIPFVYGSKVTFLAPQTAGVTTIQVSDAAGSTDEATITTEIEASSSLAPPNDPLFSQLTGLTQVQALDAWKVNTDCSKIIIGVLDSGIDTSHPDLQSNIYRIPSEDGSPSDTLGGHNFVSESSNVMDDHYHGTHVSGIIGAAGNNSVGTTGVCWRASILPLKILDSTNAGTTSDLIDAIQYGIDKGVKIFNASLINFPNNELLKNKIMAAGDAGALFIASAGNSGVNNDVTPSYPASFGVSNIISVAAIDPTTSDLASFSNFGSKSVHIAAPGVGIISTLPLVQTKAMKSSNIPPFAGKRSGTSMAVPFVVGVAALVWNANPGWTMSQVKSWVLDQANSVTKLNDKIQGSRGLNAKKSLSFSQ
jgi:subtilisin family serine protease